MILQIQNGTHVLYRDYIFCLEEEKFSKIYDFSKYFFPRWQNKLFTGVGAKVSDLQKSIFTFNVDEF